MCGIAGLLARDPLTYIRPMLNSIEHRGRDDEGVWTSLETTANGGRMCLGHRRLAIIDTSEAGHQPMLSTDGRFVLTFNGEIYNYRELRHELEAKGHLFYTDTDSEVLLNAFIEWGNDCLPRLNGMFAFAIWDASAHTLTLARDRMGIKPLYYTDTAESEAAGHAFLFASEIKALLATGLVERSLDTEALNQYLTFLWTPDPYTVFRGIKKLPPAHVLTLRDGRIKIEQWWDITFENIDYERSESSWREELLATLDEVVGMEMVADVPLGSFLSGGLDSSVIVRLMRNHGGGRPVLTYTIGMSAEDLYYDIAVDDLVWARRVGALLETDYHEHVLKPDVVELLPRLVHHMDEPTADPAIISSYLVARAASEKLTVLLSGVGGDEIFAGYPRYLAMRFAAYMDVIPSAARSPVMRTISHLTPGGMPGKLTSPLRNLKRFSRDAALSFEDRYLGFSTYFNADDKRKLLTPDLLDATREMDAYKMHRSYLKRLNGNGTAPLNRLLYLDMKTYLPCLNLTYTDKTSMAATLEVRVPYLNQKMVELAARMPPELKLRGLKRKYILKRAAESLLPDDIVWRKKAGFSAPIRSWLRGPLREMIGDLLSEENIRRRNLFRPPEVKRIIEANLSGREDYNLQVFQLLTLELWQRAFMDA